MFEFQKLGQNNEIKEPITIIAFLHSVTYVIDWYYFFTFIESNFMQLPDS